MNILLDYFFPITAIAPTPAASTAFLKQVCLIVKPNTASVGDVGKIFEVTSMAQVTAKTDNENASQLFAGGVNKIFLALSNDLLNVGTILNANQNQFFTVLVSSDFSDAEITAMPLGTFKGVVGVSSTNNAFLETQAAIENRCAFKAKSGEVAENLCFAFGKLLSNLNGWLNQQYISMPVDDEVATLGDANALFDDKVSFVISDGEFGKRLALFAAGGKAIVAPYIVKNLEIDIQSKALQYISGNMPGYTNTQAALLEDELSKVVANYIARQWIDQGVVEVKLEQENFVASGYINIAEPRAMWRIFGEIRQTL